MPLSPSSAAPVTVVIDTREQEPYGFDPDLVRSVRRALPAGDYSVAGLEEMIAVERKTLDDFVGTVMRARGASIANSASYAVCPGLRRRRGRPVDVLAGRYRRDAHPHAVLGSALAIAVDFGVPVYFCSSRQMACRFVEGYLLRAAERRAHWQTLAEGPNRIGHGVVQAVSMPAPISPRGGSGRMTAALSASLARFLSGRTIPSRSRSMGGAPQVRAAVRRRLARRPGGTRPRWTR